MIWRPPARQGIPQRCLSVESCESIVSRVPTFLPERQWLRCGEVEVVIGQMSGQLARAMDLRKVGHAELCLLVP
jgi:hypothetical protein